MDCKYVVYYVNMFLQKKNVSALGKLQYRFAAVFGRGKTMLLIKLKHCMRRGTSSKLPEQKYLRPCPALACPAHCESELHQKSQVWVMTLSAADHRNCLGRNRLSLIDQPCHLIAEFGGTQTLWLCCCPT